MCYRLDREELHRKDYAGTRWTPEKRTENPRIREPSRSSPKTVAVISRLRWSLSRLSAALKTESLLEAPEVHATISQFRLENHLLTESHHPPSQICSTRLQEASSDQISTENPWGSDDLTPSSRTRKRKEPPPSIWQKPNHSQLQIWIATKSSSRSVKSRIQTQAKRKKTKRE